MLMDSRGLMGKTYKSARFVLSYPGRAVEDSDLAFDFINSTDPLENDILKPDPAIVDAVFRLCFRDYWFRRWIRQEVLLAREIVLYCAQKRTHGASLPLCGE